MDQSLNQLTDKPANWPTNQLTGQPPNRPMNKPTDAWNYRQLDLPFLKMRLTTENVKCKLEEMG